MNFVFFWGEVYLQTSSSNIHICICRSTTLAVMPVISAVD